MSKNKEIVQNQQVEKIVPNQQGEPDKKNDKYLKPSIYENQSFETIYLKEIIRGQFVKCKIETLILEGITTLNSPFKSCEIKQVKFIDSLPISKDSKYAFYGQGIKEVHIPEDLKDNFEKNGLAMFPYSKVFYK